MGKFDFNSNTSPLYNNLKSHSGPSTLLSNSPQPPLSVCSSIDPLEWSCESDIGTTNYYNTYLQ